MRKTELYILTAIVLLLVPQLVAAEDGSSAHSRVSVFFLYNSWEEDAPAGVNDLDESAFGLRVNQFVTPEFAVDFWSTFASAGYSDDQNADLNLSSLNDTRVKGTYYFKEKLFGVSLRANLPTGKTALTAEEFTLSLRLADNSRKFVVRRFGQGLDIGGDVFVRPQFRHIGFLFGGGYIAKGRYQVLADSPAEYRYGPELHFRVMAETVNNGGPLGMSGELVYKSYGTDEFDSEGIYKSGNTLILSGRVRYSGQVSGVLGLVYLTRSKAQLPAPESATLVEEIYQSGRDEFTAYLSGTYPVNKRLRVLGRTEYRDLSANQYDPSSGQYRPATHYLGLGAGAGYSFTPILSGSAVITYYRGETNDVDDLTGLGVAMALTFRYR